MATLKEHPAARVMDLGCGEGRLVKTLLEAGGFDELLGADVSLQALNQAKARLKLDDLPKYLRIIYGPEYTAPENLEGLRPRGLKEKRSLALREYALGYEALKRFVQKEPPYRVHEAVFGVLALESEPVDPRL
ncbi:MAG: methyltransferase domain-containing protein [Elainellaceae cyanobacterium]